jgi:hypothetical protein
MKFKSVGWADVEAGQQVWIRDGLNGSEGPFNVEDVKNRLLRHPRGIKAFPGSQLLVKTSDEEE